MTVEERIYKALTESEELLSLLANGKDSVYAKQSDDAGTYPIVVIILVSAVPYMHSDDTMTAYKTVHRITALTENGANSRLRMAIYNAMIAAGFLWQDTNEVHDNDVYALSMDFEYTEEI